MLIRLSQRSLEVMNIFDNSEKNIESTSESDIESGLKLKIPKRVWDMYMNGNEIENDINIDNGLNVNDEVNVYMNIDEDEDEDTVDEEHVTKHSKVSVLNSNTSLMEGLSLLFNLQSNRPNIRSILNLTHCMLTYLKYINNGIPQSIQPTNTIVSLLEESLSAITSLQYDNTYLHLRSLHIEKFQLRVLRPMLSRLMLHAKNGGIFNTAVDVVGLELTDYYDVIKHPIDFSIIKNKLLSGVYENINSFKQDVYLIFKNALSYNSPGHIVFNKAKNLVEEAKNEIESAINKQRREDERRSTHTCEMCCGNACVLCGEKCLKLESPVLVCYGTCCQRIKKNSIYYVSSDGMYMWCQKCYTGLSTVVVEASSNGSNGSNGSSGTPGGSCMEDEDQVPIYKCDLLKRKLEDELYEPWVQCGTCNVWVHQVCALFNDRMHAALVSPSAALYNDVFEENQTDNEDNDYNYSMDHFNTDTVENRHKSIKRCHSDAS